MPRFFVADNQITENKIEIIGEDVNHIKNVLRAKIGEEIQVCNKNQMKEYTCKIERLEQEKIICNIQKISENETESNINVTIFQGLPKSDKMELIIQKSVELGVFDITPVEMKRCVVKLTEKDKNKKIERWQKISEVAAKQCERGVIPKINEISNIKNICNICEVYDIVLVAYEKEQKNTLKQELIKLKEQNLDKAIRIGIVIGPEGGLEEQEVEMLKQAGAKIVTLGKRILRTETVALNILSNIMYEWQ